VTTQEDNPFEDLETLDGIQKFVETVKEQVQKVVFDIHGIPFTGAIIAMKDHLGNVLSKPRPEFLGFGDPGKLRKMMRKHCLAMHAEGALLVHNEGRRVMFQLEHRKHGELVWYATIGEDFLFGRLNGPYTLARLEIKSLVMLPERYMS
jgi:hypothetical protein